MTETRFVRAGWLIDGTGSPIRNDVLLHIEHDRIRAITPVSGEIPDACLDLSDHTLLPGMVDCHLHLFMSGTDDPDIRARQQSASFEHAKTTIAGHLKQLLAFGVIAARDAGDREAHALRHKLEFPIPGLFRLKVAGKAWHKAGRYGGLIGRAPAGDMTLAQAISENSDGSDHVKIVQSGLNSLKEFGKQTPPQFSADELKAAAEAAKHLHLPVMVHVNGEIPTRIAIEAGCDSIEHGFFMGDDNLRRIADKGIFWVPTACTMKGYAEHLRRGTRENDIARRNLEHQLRQISKAKQFGVRIAVGTDAGCLGVHHGAAMTEEATLLADAGYSLPEVIGCATQNGANLLRLKDLGSLVPGMIAYIVAVKGPPSVLPGGLRNNMTILSE